MSATPNPATKKHIEIPLTGRPPVKVDPEVWGVIAQAKDWDGEHEFQANRRWRLTVRQHDDGRAVVYGSFDSQWQGEGSDRDGELLDAEADIAAAIYRVGEAIGASRRTVEECIADLPAEEI